MWQRGQCDVVAVPDPAGFLLTGAQDPLMQQQKNRWLWFDTHGEPDDYTEDAYCNWCWTIYERKLLSLDPLIKEVKQNTRGGLSESHFLPMNVKAYSNYSKQWLGSRKGSLLSLMDFSFIQWDAGGRASYQHEPIHPPTRQRVIFINQFHIYILPMGSNGICHSVRLKKRIQMSL